MMLSDISSLSSDEDDQEPLRRLPRRIRFIRDRENPFDLHDNDFKKRFRLNKATVMNLVRNQPRSRIRFPTVGRGREYWLARFLVRPTRQGLPLLPQF
jgi:hypothetical protein